MNKKIIALIVTYVITAFSTVFGNNLTTEQIKKFGEKLARMEHFTEEELNSMSPDEEIEITNLAEKYKDEYEHRISNYQKLTDLQLQELKNKLVAISRQEGTRSIAKKLSEQSGELLTFLHEKHLRPSSLNRKQLQDTFNKLTSNIIKTAQQIDDYQDGKTTLNYSLVEHLKQLNDLNILFSHESSDIQSLKNQLYHAKEDMRHIDGLAFTIAHSEL